MQEIEQISLQIPAGIQSGEVIEAQGKGEAGEGGYGNLYIKAHVKEHSFFQREGATIYSKIEISLSQAVLGSAFAAKTLGGDVEVRIPAGAESGEMIKLEGRGMPRLHRPGFGDHYLKIFVKTPKHLSKHARQLFEELKKEGL